MTPSFDHVARDFNTARAIPPEALAEVTDAAVRLLPRDGRILDVGIGAGRTALPLLARGLNLAGLDRSLPMMQRLRAERPAGARRPCLAGGDAARLPFADAAFDAALSVHVFQLLPQWRAAVLEVRRILKPAGVFLFGYETRPPDSPGARLLARWREIVRAAGGGAGAGDTPGGRDLDEIAAEVQRLGAQVDETRAGAWTNTRSLARHVEAIEHRTWAADWPVPPGFFTRCLDELRAWALAEYGPLETEFTVPHTFVWQAFRWR